jgi:UPF0716 protein FxsA
MPPAGLILLLFAIALPLIELSLLIKAAQAIGIWSLLSIILTTAALGVWVLQEQGLTGFRRFSEAIRQGKAPLESMMDRGLHYFAGVCLIAPGLITDTIGLLLLVPQVRSAVARIIHDAMAGKTAEEDTERPRTQRSEGEPTDGWPRRGQGERGPPPVIDGEFERIDERPIDPGAKGPSRGGG